MLGRNRIPKQIEDGRRGVDQLATPADANVIGDEAGRRDEVRHADVFIVDEQRMGEVVRVLTERLAMIALNHDERAIVQLPRPSPSNSSPSAASP